jgi:hypothetical protein
VILTINYNDTKYEIFLEDDKNYTLADLIPYIQTLLGITEGLIITNANNEILAPNSKIVELILIDSTKYKNLSIKTFGSLSTTRCPQQYVSSMARKEEHSKNSNFANPTNTTNNTNNNNFPKMKDNSAIYDQSSNSDFNLREKYLNEPALYSDKKQVMADSSKFEGSYKEYNPRTQPFTRNINYDSDINKEYSGISDYSTMNFASPQNIPKENYKQFHTERRIFRNENNLRKPFKEEKIKQDAQTEDYMRNTDYIIHRERNHSQDPSDYSFNEQKKSYTGSVRRGYNY